MPVNKQIWHDPSFNAMKIRHIDVSVLTENDHTEHGQVYMHLRGMPSTSPQSYLT